MHRGWTKVKDGAKYSSLSERSFRNHLKSGLRHIRLQSGTVLIKYEWIDEYFEQFEASENTAGHIDKIIDECLEDMKG